MKLKFTYTNDESKAVTVAVLDDGAVLFKDHSTQQCGKVAFCLLNTDTPQETVQDIVDSSRSVGFFDWNAVAAGLKPVWREV